MAHRNNILMRDVENREAKKIMVRDRSFTVNSFQGQQEGAKHMDTDLYARDKRRKRDLRQVSGYTSPNLSSSFYTSPFFFYFFCSSFFSFPFFLFLSLPCLLFSYYQLIELNAHQCVRVFQMSSPPRYRVYSDAALVLLCHSEMLLEDFFSVTNSTQRIHHL